MLKLMLFGLIMLILFYIRVGAALAQFKQKYPRARFKRNHWSVTLINFLKTYVLFCIPIVNLILLFLGWYGISEEDWERACAKNTESLW
jgi:hypothetical protein